MNENKMIEIIMRSWLIGETHSVLVPADKYNFVLAALIAKSFNCNWLTVSTQNDDNTTEILFDGAI